MKTRQNNDVPDHTRALYAENDIGLLWPIELGIFNKN